MTTLSGATAPPTAMPQRDAVLGAYRALLLRRVRILVLLAAALAAALCLDVATGPSRLTLGDTASALVLRAVDPAVAVIVWELRLPAALMAVLVGAALSLAGAEMQTTLNNPLASPFTLGLSSAAVFGAALVIVGDVGIPGVPQDWLLPATAFALAFAAALMLQGAMRSGVVGTEALVLLGIALFFTFNALVAILQFVATEQALQQLVFWTMGSLGRSSWARVAVIAATVAVIVPWSMASAWSLTALRLGDERAGSVGVDVGRVRLSALLRTSALTGVSVAFVGTIAFVGLVGPHIARLLLGEDHRFFLPASALAGALILSLASIGSKVIVPGAVIPIGLVTALIGVPFFVWLLVQRREAW